MYSHVLDRPCNQLGICPSTQLFCIPTVWVGKVTRLTGAYCRSSACNVKMGCKKEKSATHLGEQQPEAGPMVLGISLQIPTLQFELLALPHLLVVFLHHLGYKKCGSLFGFWFFHTWKRQAWLPQITRFNQIHNVFHMSINCGCHIQGVLLRMRTAPPSEIHPDPSVVDVKMTM